MKKNRRFFAALLAALMLSVLFSASAELNSTADPAAEIAVDVSAAREETSAENPAQLGEWIKSARNCVETHNEELIYWRITDITTDCQETIDRYNSEGHITVFEPLENEDLAYYKVTYEVYFPEDFPCEASYGIASAELSSLRAKSPDGGGIKWKGMAYIGLGSSKNVAVDQEIFPGDVYVGEAIYVMIDDPSVEYVFEYYHHAAGESEGDLIYDYAACR